MNQTNENTQGYAGRWVRSRTSNRLRPVRLPWVSVGITISLVVCLTTLHALQLAPATVHGLQLASRVYVPFVSVAPAVLVGAGDIAGAPAVLVGAGDIASCTSRGDEATAALLDSIAGTVFTTGDNVYPDGTFTDFATCYEASWGRHKSRTRPTPGNHEYHTPGASGYFTYFGAAAGDPSKGYYSYDLGAWHIVVLNSNISMAAGSPQEQWLRSDLAAHPATCTLAYWHQPRFSSGRLGSSTKPQPLWQALYDSGADVVLVGHDHTYERFAPQDPTGKLDVARGLRQFVAGMGGASHHAIDAPIANSEVHNDDTYGVLKLTLHAASYDWQFIPEAGRTFTDEGSSNCH